MNLKLTLASNIKRYRIKNNLSQEKLAEICNLHRTYIGSIERAERNVTLNTLESLSNALNISVIKLLTDRRGKNA